MAARLLDAGHDVAVWNRTPERADPLVAKGARRAATPAEAADGAEAVLTMLATPEAVRDVVAALPRDAGATLVEMSTIGPSAVRAIAEDRDGNVLDAPVLGSIPQATDGTLKIFVGGDADLFARFRPVLETLGTPRRVGPLGAGAAMKLVTNLCLGVLMTGLGEALALADGLGLQQSEVLDVLAESPIGVTTRSKRDNIESGTWPARFKLSLAAKDLRLVAEEADRSGLRLDVASRAGKWLQQAEGDGRGDADYSVVIDTIRSSSDT